MFYVAILYVVDGIILQQELLSSAIHPVHSYCKSLYYIYIANPAKTEQAYAANRAALAKLGRPQILHTHLSSSGDDELELEPELETGPWISSAISWSRSAIFTASSKQCAANS